MALEGIRTSDSEEEAEQNENKSMRSIKLRQMDTLEVISLVGAP